MGADTKIEYVERTVNFWMGCEPVSEGCEHCYARGFWRRMRMKPGERRRVSNKTIQATLRKAKPGDFVFVNSLSDFFDDYWPQASHPWRVGATRCFVRRDDLTFLLLTKRPKIMKHWADWVQNICNTSLSNVWLGVTAENQARADERIPQLLDIDWPGKKFVSIEPMLGEIDLRRWLAIYTHIGPPCCIKKEGYHRLGHATTNPPLPELDWVILGGETGAQARPMKPDWARSVRDQCHAAGVPFFFKAWGGKKTGAVLDGREWKERP